VLYALLADSLVVLHGFFILFVLLGGLMVARWRWIAWLHLPAAAWGVAVELTGWVCPLTPFENLARHLAGQAGYQGGFVEHYLLAMIYPAHLTRGIQVALGVFTLLVNLLAYGWAWWRTAAARDEHSG
jgi:hypothetical protein